MNGEWSDDGYFVVHFDESYRCRGFAKPSNLYLTPQQVLDIVGLLADQMQGWHVTVPKAAELVAKHGSKSGAIRALAAAGTTRSEIAKLLGIRYQHVHNVMRQEVTDELNCNKEGG